MPIPNLVIKFDSGSDLETYQARIHKQDTLAATVMGATSEGRGEDQAIDFWLCLLALV